MTVLKHLRRYREEQAMTQRQLSEKSGVTQATIVHAEKGGDTRPTTVRKLADALGIEPRKLIGSTGDND
jgi:transcriptional regulator with XRE-family HTH domain